MFSLHFKRICLHTQYYNSSDQVRSAYTLSTRGFFLASGGMLCSRPKRPTDLGLRPKALAARVTIKTGPQPENGAWKDSGTQGKVVFYRSFSSLPTLLNLPNKKGRGVYHQQLHNDIIISIITWLLTHYCLGNSTTRGQWTRNVRSSKNV